MTDVARHSGVSQSTVSYVINGTRKISDETRRTVEKSIRELGYTPNAAAQALRGERSNTLVVSAPGASESTEAIVGLYFLEIATAARTAGYDLLIATDSVDSQGSLQRILRSGRADAALVMLALVEGDPRLAQLASAGYPAVVIGEPDPIGTLPFVDFDFESAGAIAVNALADWGHHNILYVGWSEDEEAAGLLYARRTLAGIRHAAEQRTAHITHLASNRRPDEQDAAIRQALQATPRPSAVICAYVGGFHRVRDLFHQANPGAETSRSVIALGTTGRFDSPGNDATRIENPVAEIAANAVRLAAAHLAGESAPSIKLVPRLTLATETERRRGIDP